MANRNTVRSSYSTPPAPILVRPIPGSAEISGSRARPLKYAFSHQFTQENISFFSRPVADIACLTPSQRAFRSAHFGPSGQPSIIFYMKVYPHGYKEHQRDFVSFFLCFYASSTKQELMIKYTVSVIDGNGEKSHTFSIETYQSVVRGRGLGLPQFIPRSQLLDPENNLIVNDSLTILCEVEIILDHFLEAVSSPLTPMYNQREQYHRAVKILSKQQGKLLESGQDSDVTLLVDGTQLRAHKALLRAASPVFDAMLSSLYTEGQCSQVVISDLSVEVVQAMLEFIYTAKTEKMFRLDGKLLEAADKYDLASLKETCIDSLLSKMSPSTALETLILADRHALENLKETALEYITSHANDVMATPGWKSLRTSAPELLDTLYRLQVEKVTATESTSGGMTPVKKRTKTSHTTIEL